jgi:hypothetical protein
LPKHTAVACKSAFAAIASGRVIVDLSVVVIDPSDLDDQLGVADGSL